MGIERGPSVDPDAHVAHLFGRDLGTHAVVMQQMLDLDHDRYQIDLHGQLEAALHSEEKPAYADEVPVQIDLGHTVELEDFTAMEAIEPASSKEVTKERSWSDGQDPRHRNDIAWDY